MIGLERYWFLFAIAFIWIIVACVQDLGRRERIVDNWVSFSLIAFALAYRAFYSAYSSDWMFFSYGLMGFGLFLVLANGFYYSRMFGGADAKLLMGFGAVLPIESFWDLVFVGLGFVLLLLFVGTIYSLIYSFFIVGKNYKKFSLEFGKNIGRGKNWAYASVFALLLVVLVYIIAGTDILLLIIAVLFALFVFILFVYARSLENCMIKLISPGKLTEGDWLVGDVRAGKGVVRKTVHGLSAEDIVKLKKAGKKVLIKEGIPFTPAFFAAFVVMVFFLAVLGLDFSNLLSLLF